MQGHLDRHWSTWLEGLAISYDEDGTTRLRRNLVDEAALHGVLMKARDLAIPLLSVNRVSNSTEEQGHQGAEEQSPHPSKEASPSRFPLESVTPDEREP